MKLANVWQVMATTKTRPVSSWGALVSLKKPPKVAYRLLKYGAKLSAEFDVIENQRRALIYEAAKVPEGANVKIEPGTPEFDQFVQSFNAFLAGDSDLEWSGIAMEALIEALDSEKGNVFSEADLELLEPFFTEPTKAEVSA